MNTSPLLNPSNLTDFAPVDLEFLRALNTTECSPFRALVMPVRQNGIDKEIYEGRASRTLEVWTRPGKSTFYVRNHDGQIFTLYRTKAALNDDNDSPDIIGLTEFTWQILEYIDVDKLTDKVFLPEFPSACFEDAEFEGDIDYDNEYREWLAHSMFNLDC